MSTPLLNSLGVFIMGNTALITHVLFMTAFLAVVLAIAFGRNNVVTVAFLQLARFLSFVFFQIPMGKIQTLLY